MSFLKRLLLGRPIASTEQEHQRLSKKVALAVFSSDAISSTAYATQEILLVLVPLGGYLAFQKLIPISLAVGFLLAIVGTSYFQTLHAYPGGGGSYRVSRDNLGRNPSLIAGASLLTDYILTVAVSVSAGVAAITSAFPGLRDFRVLMCVSFVLLLAMANLRGVKESGRLFALPTYVYIFTLGGLIVYGIYRAKFGDLEPISRTAQHAEFNELTENGTVLAGISMFALFRAFASGAVALTGIEAISNGVPAFRRPESRNASITLIWMLLILGSFFIGISVLAGDLQPIPSATGETVLSALGNHVFGDGSPIYFVLQGATMAILLLAANTSFADFPRVSSILAGDGFLPRQFVNRGDRLVFSNGVLILAAAAIVLLVSFNGNTTRLIPLYAIGVFASFCLSDAGMVKHHLRLREKHWKRGIVINATGAIASFAVLLDAAISKFLYGAWIILLVIPIIISFFLLVNRHYRRVSESLKIPDNYKSPRMDHTVVVLVARVHRGVLEALAYAKSLAPNHLVAISVVSDEDEQRSIEQQWADQGIDIPLEIIYSPYRELARPVLRYMDELEAAYGNERITVVVPEFVVKRWYERLLHNQSAFFLKARLLFRKGTVVTSVPYHVDD